MKALLKSMIMLLVLTWIVGCASQPEAPIVAEEVEVQETPMDAAPEPVAQPSPIKEEGVAGFKIGDGTMLSDGQRIILPTGGPVSGRLVPTSINPDVTLYVSRDGGIPTADANWGGPMSPASPNEITGTIEGTAVYRVVASLDGEFSEAFSVVVVWQHEDQPVISTPAFLVNGSSLTGATTLPVSDGSAASGRLHIDCDYQAATLYITRDGSDPSPDNFWKSQVCSGTYIFSPEETAAVYRVIAVWQGTKSEVAELTVTWVTAE